MGDDDNQALTARTRKGKGKKDFHSPKKFQKSHKSHQKKIDLIKCFSCQKLGHIAKICPNKEKQRKGNTKDIMLILQKMMDLYEEEEKKTQRMNIP